MKSMQIDQLQLYRGGNIVIDDNITIHQPTLSEICDFGEQRYFSTIYTICSVAADMKYQLFTIGIDYTEVSDFDLFCKMLAPQLSQEDTSIIFNDLNLQDFIPLHHEDLDEMILFDPQKDIMITRFTYQMIVEYLRQMHNLTRNNEVPANENTKQILIADAKEEFLENQNKEYKSKLIDLVSAMINSEGFKGDFFTVFDMPIFAFMDSVQRIGKIKKSNLLLQSGYSGFGIDLSKIDKKELDWLGGLSS